MLKTFRARSFGFLLASLLCIFVCHPLAMLATGGATIVNAVEIAVAFTAVVTAMQSRAQMFRLAFLALAATAIDWTNDYSSHHVPALAVLKSGLSIAFFSWTVATILRRVLAPDRVTANEVLGATCIYLLLAVIWAHAFYIVDIVAPGAFRGISNDVASGAIESDLLYFSLTTLTTYGIGDILPVNRVARMLVALEAVIGQLYLAILVARFVGLHVAHSKQK